MKKITLNVKGMHCPSCEVLVKDSLDELEGIDRVKTNSKSGIVEVDFDESKTDIDKIKSVIIKEGYKAE